jgi:hypothetical protein
MIRTAFLTTLVAALASLALARSPAAAAPGAPLGVAQALGSIADQMSFWGHPYPAGYAYGHPYTYAAGYRGPCYRKIRVDTPVGWRWRRVWVCG